MLSEGSNAHPRHLSVHPSKILFLDDVDENTQRFQPSTTPTRGARQPTMKRGTPVPASGLAMPSHLYPSDSLDVSNEEGNPSWDSYDMFPQSESPILDHFHRMHQPDDGVAIVRHIASFLTLSDAASIASMDRIIQHEATPDVGNDWAVGMEWSTSWNSLATPPTPGLMALSPSESSLDAIVNSKDWDGDEEDEGIQRRLKRRHQQWVQQKLTAAVFSHPRSIRSYCLEAHQAAKEIQRNRRERQDRHKLDPETLREPPEGESMARRELGRSQRRSDKHAHLLHFLVDTLLHNVPLTVMIDLAETVMDTGLDTSYAVFCLSVSSVNAVVSGLLHAIQRAWDVITSFNPFAILDAIISMQFNAMGKTSEALASGIQSVATGVGSASTMALQRLSRGGGSGLNMTTSSSSLNEKVGLRRSRSSQNNIILNQKLLRKLSTINDAAQVIAYREREEEVLTRHAKKRMQRMMHYEVNLRPFLATVVDPPRRAAEDPFGNVDFPSYQIMTQGEYPDEVQQLSPQSSPSSSPLLESPFMCTPQSFPQTPASRSLVLARGTRFADDVVFRARDNLRVERGLESDNERTRAMAKALREGKRLAVFNAEDVANGIALSCGQHVATKVGNSLYCCARSMCPVLRNCFVYFEMTAMCPPPAGNTSFPGSTATLSIGLSTLEMPLNTVVGAWKSSVGLCSTGQIMTAGQWWSPLDPSLSSYGNNATVGCLVCLDDSSAFETWDGVMVTASVTFNVNGVIVSPPVSTAPVSGGLMPMPSRGSGVPENRQAQQLYGLTPTATLPLLVPMEEELFPTLTLHSHATQVMCRFSAEDVLATSSVMVGAPEGATVYAVDGSVLFNGRH